jgi:AcrR family transcriptional regulator
MKKKDKNTKEKIIEVALKVFGRKGYFKTTVDDIANAVGLAKGTLYLYFKDKESLYIATIDHQFENALNFLSEIETKKGSSTQKMTDIASKFVVYMKELGSTHTLFTIESLNLSEKILKHIKPIIIPKLTEMTEMVSRIIKEGIKKGEFKDVNPDVAAYYFLNTIRTIFSGSVLMPHLANNANAILELYFEGLKKTRGS